VKKHFKRKNLLAIPQDEQSITDPINKIQQQLGVIAEKLDILISQSSKRPFEKSYSQKPSGRFNRSNRHDSRRQGNGPRERNYTRVVCADCKKECEIPFKPSAGRPVYCKECFQTRKAGSLFIADRDNRSKERNFPREHRSDKRPSGKRQKSDKKQKPFFARRKKRI